MRAHLLLVTLAAMLAGTGARAQCLAGQDGGTSGCGGVYALSVSPLPQNTTAPRLEIDAVVQDNGAIFAKGPGVVFVTVRGPSDAGGGALALPDGGTDSTFDQPYVALLSPGTYSVNTGVFTTFFDGGTSLFIGENTITVSAVEPNGARLDSAPQIIRLDLALDGGSGGGTGSDGGVTGGSDGGGTGGGDGGFLPDGGALTGASPALVVGMSSGDSAQGCSTTDGGPPSFLLMALAVMLAGFGRRAMRG